MIMGFGSAIVQGGLVGRMTKKYGEGAVIRVGIIVSAVGFILILFSTGFWTSAVFLTIFGVGNGFIRPAISALLTKVPCRGMEVSLDCFLPSTRSAGLQALR